MQGLDVWRNPQIYVVGTSPLCGRIPGLSPGQRKLCQLRQVSPRPPPSPRTAAQPPVHHPRPTDSHFVTSIEDLNSCIHMRLICMACGGGVLARSARAALLSLRPPTRRFSRAPLAAEEPPSRTLRARLGGDACRTPGHARFRSCSISAAWGARATPEVSPSAARCQSKLLTVLAPDSGQAGHESHMPITCKEFNFQSAIDIRSIALLLLYKLCTYRNPRLDLT